MIRLTRVSLAALLVAAAAFLPAAAADAAPTTGWVRLAHLSPDTKQVNITLSSLTGGTVLYRLKNVGYGQVSKYMHLPAGSYAIAMTPSGVKTRTPVVKAAVDVKAGVAETVAAMGPNAQLTPKVFRDDLSTAAGSGARVRVIQASTVHRSVDVTAGSTSVARGLRFGTASDYARIPSGRVAFTLKGGSAEDSASRTFAAGTVHTVFVLDSKQGFALGSVQDSASATETPVGPVETGGGALSGGGVEPLAGLLAALAAAAAIGVGCAIARPARTSVPQPRP